MTDYLATGHPVGGDFRELGKRVLADGGLRPADDVPDSEGIAGIATTGRDGARRCRSARLRRRSRCAVACQARRLDPAALRAFAWARLRSALPASRGLGTPLAGSRNTPPTKWRIANRAPTFTDYLTSSRFWFESFQNWQSEFLAIAVDGLARGVPATAMVAGIETRTCAACRDGTLKGITMPTKGVTPHGPRQRSERIESAHNGARIRTRKDGRG